MIVRTLMMGGETALQGLAWAMTRLVAVAGCVMALLAGAALAGDPPATSPAAPVPVIPSAAEQPIKQVALDPNAPYPVCRRIAPTGSRIKNEVCEAPNTDGNSRKAEREQIRRDMDEMRARQTMRDQVRAQSLAEAMRRR